MLNVCSMSLLHVLEVCGTTNLTCIVQVGKLGTCEHLMEHASSKIFFVNGWFTVDSTQYRWYIDLPSLMVGIFHKPDRQSAGTFSQLDTHWRKSGLNPRQHRGPACSTTTRVLCRLSHGRPTTCTVHVGKLGACEHLKEHASSKIPIYSYVFRRFYFGMDVIFNLNIITLSRWKC